MLSQSRGDLGQRQDGGDLFRRLEDMLDACDRRGPPDDPAYLRARLSKHKELLNLLNHKFRTSEDKRIVMESRNTHLLTENTQLQLKLAAEKQKAEEMQQQLRCLQRHHEEYNRLKQEYSELCNFAKNSEKKKRDGTHQSTSCSDLLPEQRTVATQSWTNDLCWRCGASAHEGEAEPVIKLRRPAATQLSADLEALRAALARREARWGKQGTRLNRMRAQKSELRAMAESRAEELEMRTRALRELTEENARISTQLACAKRHLREERTPRRRPHTPADGDR